MTELPGFDSRSPSASSHPAEAASKLRECEGRLRAVIKDLQLAEQTPDRVLDPQAAALYPIVLKIRNTVNSALEYLSKTGWRKDHRSSFDRAFTDIQDAWIPYRTGLEALENASWGRRGQPTPVDVMTSLRGPRRQYIEALNVYYNHLVRVLTYL